jgi:hypothetical protein
MLRDAPKTGNLKFQWLGNWKEEWRKDSSRFLRGWLKPDGKCYYKQEPTDRSHKPYTSETTSTKIGRQGVMVFGFKLRSDYTLPAATRRVIEQTWRNWQKELG